MEKSKKILVRVPEMAELLSISRTKAYDMVAKGEIPSVRLGGDARRGVRIPLAAIERLAEQSLPALGR